MDVLGIRVATQQKDASHPHRVNHGFRNRQPVHESGTRERDVECGNRLGQTQAPLKKSRVGRHDLIGGLCTENQSVDLALVETIEDFSCCSKGEIRRELVPGGKAPGENPCLASDLVHSPLGMRALEIVVGDDVLGDRVLDSGDSR